MKIAVTGASGFIGSSLIRHAVFSGFDVLALTRSPYSIPLDSSSIFNCLPVDYLDTSRLAEELLGCHVLIHLVGRAHCFSDLSNTLSLSLFDNANIVPLISIAEASKMAGISRVVFISSIGVNGPTTYGIPFSEESLPNPAEYYSISKLKAEQHLAEILDGTSTDWTILRLPLVYGPNCPGNFNRLIKFLMKSPVVPFGSVNSLRSFIGIDNLVDAILLASVHSSISRRVILLSDQDDVTLSSVIRILLEGLEQSWKFRSVPICLLQIAMKTLRKQDLWAKFSAELLIDSSFFSDLTGWHPVVSTKDCLLVTAKSFLPSQRVLSSK